MKNRMLTLLTAAGLVLSLPFLFLASGSAASSDTAGSVNRPPVIDPDYSDCVLPPNIAPVNFLIREPGTKYEVRIQSPSGDRVQITTKKPVVDIPVKKWKRFLESAAGGEITFEISVRDSSGKWNRFQPIRNRISKEEIDGYLVYRLTEPIYVRSKNMQIVERSLSDFKTRIVLNYQTVRACMNCHSFPQNDPDKMILHVRYGDPAGMLLVQNGCAVKIDTRTKFNKSPAAYRSWHPDGKRIAFSVNVVKQFFHSTGETREAFDSASDLIVYDIEKNEITTSPKISSIERMETYPEWSPDGQYLYYCCAPSISHKEDISHQYPDIFYDLMRIRYDASNDSWGDPERVLSSSKLGKSIAHPKFSSDGRFLLFCLTPYGTFSLFRPGGDLAMMDMRTGKVEIPDINSDQPESYHSWSNNGRWFVFSSKRRNGLCTLNYISHVDENGRVSKPFLLPQKDPTLHEHEFYTYNVPELIKSPVRTNARELTRILYDNEHLIKAGFDPDLEIEETTGASPRANVMPAIQ